MQKLFTILFIFSTFTGCKNNIKVERLAPKNSESTIRYAKGFTIEKNDSCKILTVFNPWQDAKGVNYKYIFTDSTRKNSLADDDNIEAFIAPLGRIICLSTTHIAFIDLLQKTNRIVGVSGSAFVNSKDLLPRIQDLSVKEVGYDQNLNYELIVSLRPDAVLCYGVGAESVGYLLKLKELGVKIIFIGDYLEENPLGKAEWIKAFGLLLNAEEVAVKTFNSIELEYNTAAKLAKEAKDKPKVFLNMPWKDSWFFPGGSNYFVKLIDDAGGDYIFKNLEGSRSYSIAFEKAFEAGMNSNIWLNTGTALSLNDIKQTDERLQTITPFTCGMVYNNNKRTTISGGNDFWESGVVHPDLILKDLIFIFHPELLPNHEFNYYQKIK
jgi:iron complex transport system substrate-binding protein